MGYMTDAVWVVGLYCSIMALLNTDNPRFNAMQMVILWAYLLLLLK